MNMQKIQKPYAGKIIAVAIKKGGTGKSVFSMNIAPEVEPDVFYDTDDTPAVSTFNQFRPEDKQWNVIRLTDKIMMSSGSTIQQFASDLIDAREQGKTVLVDCGGFDSALTRTAVALADIIISPVNDDPSDILGLQEFSTVLNEISAEMGIKKVAHVVLNKVHPTRTNFKAIDTHLERFDNLIRVDTAIPRDNIIPEKFGEGLGIVEHITTRHGRAGNAMRSLYLKIRKILNEMQ